MDQMKGFFELQLDIKKCGEDVLNYNLAVENINKNIAYLAYIRDKINLNHEELLYFFY